MLVVFKNPTSFNNEIGFILKKYNTKWGIKYDLMSEAGVEHSRLSDNKNKAGFVNFDLTNKIIDKIHTNLDKYSKGNFKNPINIFSDNLKLEQDV